MMKDHRSTSRTPSRRKLALHENCVVKLRTDDLPRLTRFCKMHLSFVLDLDSDKFEALLGDKDEQRKSIGSLFQKMKGSKSVTSDTQTSTPTSNHGKASQVCYGEGICHLIQFLEKDDNLMHEGLFRKCGNMARQKDLKEKLISGSLVDFSLGYYTAHDCASVLKSLLSDLSEPLLLERLCNTHISLKDYADEQNRLKAVTLLLQMLPAENYNLAHKLFSLLYKVSKEAEHNKMSADNLGAMFAPHLLCPKKMSGSELHNTAGAMQAALSFIIQNGHQVFKVPEMLALDVLAHMKEMNIAMDSCSEESMISCDSLDSSTNNTSRLKRKSKGGSHSSNDDQIEPLNTVVAYAERQTCGNTQDSTALELAKLYAHVQSMPESAKKRKLMKQFSEANGYTQQVEMKRKNSRGKSLGDSIRKKFNRHMRQKSGVMNVTTASQDSENQSTSSSLVNSSENKEQQHGGLTITPFCESPYPLHRHSLRHINPNTQLGDSPPTPEQKSCPVPAIKKALLPSTLSSDESPRLKLTRHVQDSPSQTLNCTPPNKPATKLKRVKECQLTPPVPKTKRPMVILDANIIV